MPKKLVTKAKTKKAAIIKEGAKTSESAGKISQSKIEHIVIRQSDDSRARWYVVHTYSSQEGRVAATLKERVESMNLTEYVLEIMVPTQEKIEIRSGQKQKIRERIFPGYILVKMILTDQSWLAVRTTPGVTGFVGTGDQPTPLAEEEVASIRNFMAQAAPKFKAKFTTGEAVRIIDGPFSDFLGSVSEIDEARGKVKVLVSIFGRETPVELDLLQVTKI